MKYLHLTAGREHQEGESLKMQMRNGKMMNRIPEKPGKEQTQGSCRNPTEGPFTRRKTLPPWPQD